MWYDKREQPLDFDKPIIAKKTENNHLFILIPQIASGSGYKIIGYNWLGLSSGKYNSCIFYKTVESAIQAYSNSCGFFNADLEELINNG